MHPMLQPAHLSLPDLRWCAFWHVCLLVSGLCYLLRREFYAEASDGVLKVYFRTRMQNGCASDSVVSSNATAPSDSTSSASIRQCLLLLTNQQVRTHKRM